MHIRWALMTSRPISFTSMNVDTLEKLNCLFNSLGWPAIKEERRILEPRPERDEPRREIVWYEGHSKHGLTIIINRQPCWNCAVYALRYRLFSGWHEFALGRTSTQLLMEASRLESTVAHEWFATAQGRCEYRKNHPLSAGFTWEKVRALRPPT